MKKQLVGAALCAATVVGLGGSVFAGEINGTGKPLWTNTTDPEAPHELHGKSICAFSGLNDFNFLYPGETDPDGFGRTQSYGQAVRQGQDVKAIVDEIFGSPGETCRGNIEFTEPD